jgi:hypothetical protein
MASASDAEFAQAIMLREWDEAWAHSRHLETMRSQYLGFFFTAALAITAFTAPQIADDSLGTSGALVTVAVLVLGLHGLTTFLYLAIFRINQVLNYYRTILIAIRAQVHDKPGLPIDLNECLRLPPTSRGRLTSRLTTTQGVAETVLQIGIAAFVVTLVVDGARALTLEAVSPMTRAVCLAALIAALAITAAAWWSVQRAETLVPPSEPKP